MSVHWFLVDKFVEQWLLLGHRSERPMVCVCVCSRLHVFYVVWVSLTTSLTLTESGGTVFRRTVMTLLLWQSLCFHADLNFETITLRVFVYCKSSTIELGSRYFLSECFFFTPTYRPISFPITPHQQRIVTYHARGFAQASTAKNCDMLKTATPTLHTT